MEYVFVSKSSNIELVEYLNLIGREVITVEPSPDVNELVCDHPDIFMCRFFDGELLRARKGEVGRVYPNDIPFNAVCLGKYFIHSLKHTNPKLLARSIEKGLIPVNVNQGYTKCNTCIVDENSVITSDPSIISAVRRIDNINLLEICSGHIALKGAQYGFIGGASGKIGDEIVFNGDLSSHPDYNKIADFIISRNLRVKFFPDYPLTDIGSII